MTTHPTGARSMSPEERAREIVKSCDRGWDWQVSETREEELVALIASAIRDAEDAALERAAQLAITWLKPASHIRNLKSKEI